MVSRFRKFSTTHRGKTSILRGKLGPLHSPPTKVLGASPDIAARVPMPYSGKLLSSRIFLLSIVSDPTKHLPTSSAQREEDGAMK